MLVVALVGRIHLIDDIVMGNTGNLSQTDVDASDNFVGSATPVEAGLYLLAAIVVLFWLHRVVANNWELLQQGLRFTPGWAVGWWFIPFANLVRPAQVMSETWRASDPRQARSNPESRRQVGIGLVIAWWAAFLLGGVVGRVAVIAGGSGDALDTLRTHAQITIAEMGFEVIAAALLVMLVVRISRRQDVKVRAVAQTLPAPTTPA